MQPNHRKKIIDNKVDDLFDVPCVRQGGRRRIILGSSKTHRTVINCQMGQQCAWEEKFSCQKVRVKKGFRRKKLYNEKQDKHF